MESRHTKGDWQVRTHSYNPQHSSAIVSNHTILVADIYINSHSNCNEAEANAKLIAAAPDLLETLQNIIGVLEAIGSGDTIIAKAAKEAIEKATK
ncbi:MAG: hypothetical protein JJE55_08050 [Flavobacteriaceae bacterium]|nr:hypothetical protein [Flavobacteriaceae bacterium]